MKFTSKALRLKVTQRRSLIMVTNNFQKPKLNLKTPIQYLKGVGPNLAKKLKKLGIETVEDLIFLFPRDYEDRSNPTPINKLVQSESVFVRAVIDRVSPQSTKSRFSVTKVLLTDRTGSIQAVWFNQPFLNKMFRPGMRLIVSGKVEFSTFDGSLQLIARDYEIDAGEKLGIVPIYPLTEGVFQKKLRSMVESAVDACLEEIQDFLPQEIKAQHHLIELQEAINAMHFPSILAEIEKARYRLAFDDFFFFQLGLGLHREKVAAEPGIAFKIEEQALAGFLASLPFELTGAQKRVLADIVGDMKQAKPMNRLIQGDVGSGKTVVAAAAGYLAVKAGYQVAIMAPTEILANQHLAKIQKFFENQNIKVELLTASTSKDIHASDRLKNADFVIGTHALIEAKAEYRNLGLIVIDEQHRFGVLQRADLVKKGSFPDVLVMTATPIPRSLALTVYGDLDRSIIDELPPGRTPIKTYYVTESKRKSSYEFIRQKVKEGQQIFIVCPLVDESEKIDLKAATDEANYLQTNIFPELKVGLLHGKLKSEDKDLVMQAFAGGKINILVSTTVIEVGIDVPNATVMVVEHVERFGLSQLHQLRGRIGRGAHESYCFLIGQAKTEEAKTRIKAMLDSTDGFYIAEVDLKLRGPGDFLGVRQSGLPNFRVADIIRDEKILRQARAAAFDLIDKDLKNARNIWHSQREKTQEPAERATLN